MMRSTETRSSDHVSARGPRGLISRTLDWTD